MGIRAPIGATVLVNVYGDVATMGHFDIQLMGGLAAGSVLFHFPDATSLDITGIDVNGSIVAPKAFVTFDNGQMHGTVVADRIEGAGEFYQAGPFRGRWVCR